MRPRFIGLPGFANTLGSGRVSTLGGLPGRESTLGPLPRRESTLGFGKSIFIPTLAAPCRSASIGDFFAPVRPCAASLVACGTGRVLTGRVVCVWGGCAV